LYACLLADYIKTLRVDFR